MEILFNGIPKKIYPAARYSDRVFFGTGPAMIKGRSGDWSSYPFYNFALFDEVEESFNAFSYLFDKDIDFPMMLFLSKHFRDDQWYNKLRKNNPSKERFVKACYDKVDALRILQYLKSNHSARNETDNENLLLFLNKFYPKETIANNFTNLDFDHISIHELNLLRDFMVEKEEEHQKYVWKK